MQIVKAPNQILRTPTKPVKKLNGAYLDLFKEMVKLTKTFKDPEGVGLAATQIGKNESFFVGLLDKTNTSHFVVAINPKITSMTKNTKVYFEGCLSIPNYYGEVIRHTNIRVEYMDEKGKLVKKALSGVPAWIFQHEVDHLNGVLFPDRVLEQKGKFYKWTGRDPETEEDHFEEVEI